MFYRFFRKITLIREKDYEASHELWWWVRRGRDKELFLPGGSEVCSGWNQ
jgi:hypothetical protein